MTEEKKCRSCGGKLTQRETQKKANQLKKVYYYTAYYYCIKCRKIYLDDKFKITNEQKEGGMLFTEDEHTDFDVEIWTDGACVFNGQTNARAAWAFVSGKTEKSGLVAGSKQTNNVAEGMAILKAIQWAVKSSFKNIKIYTDSQITIHNLKKPAVQIKQNREIFLDIEKLINQNNLKVHYEKVLGHSGDFNNERADKLANELAGIK